jgi:hypothetical protein
MPQQCCTFCSSPATHTLYPNRRSRHLEARLADFPRARQEYCQRCAEALAGGESGEALARRLNRAHHDRLGDDEETNSCRSCHPTS